VNIESEVEDGDVRFADDDLFPGGYGISVSVGHFERKRYTLANRKFDLFLVD